MPHDSKPRPDVRVIKRDTKAEDYKRQHEIALLKLLMPQYPELVKEFALTIRKVIPHNCG